MNWKVCGITSLLILISILHTCMFYAKSTETCNYRKSLSYVGIDYYKLCLNAKTLRITLIIQKFILCEKLNYDFRPKCRFFHFSRYIITCKGNKGEG